MTKMGSLPGDSRDSGCPISVAGCKMCQPYRHNCTGILNQGPELKELFSQLFAPLNHPSPFFLRSLRFGQAKPFGIRSYFSVAASL